MLAFCKLRYTQLLADADVDQMCLDRGGAMAGLFLQIWEVENVITCHSLFHVRDRSIDELTFRCPRSLRPDLKRRDVINKGR